MHLIVEQQTLIAPLPDDQSETIAAIRRGDSKAFAELCETIEDRLLRQANFLCKDADAAQDLAQETLFAAWKSFDKYHGNCQFFTWVCGIMIRQYRNYLRKSRRFPLSFSWLAGKSEARELDAERIDQRREPSEALADRELDAHLRGCLQDLSAKHREVIYLRFYADDSLDGIAKALGCSVGTVKSRLFHALEQLRKMKARLGELR